MDDSSKIKSPSGDDGLALEAQARALASEQSALLEGSPLQARYNQALGEYVEQKAEQAQALEQRLETLVERQQAQLQQSLSVRPGWLAMPSARAAWQQNNERCQARLLDLQSRLERVQDLHHGMGLYTPHLEELAARRLRAEQPELAEQWSLQRQAERELTESQRRTHTNEIGRSRTSSP
ncbi:MULTISPECIES: IncP plasmid survival protein KfrC family protein [Pseudomonas]|uniref:IncP plasmid survival protein KfrC family protein n=1 Tax=Pseudomonas TaxID=286 RepID=UPI0023D84171|nr:IncP plasmid survival protein KfrC family protein [Pseudomonas sp. PSE14]WEJ71952.1 conjugal transfer protein [Pseudomonas sp. PSE14]